MPNEEINIKSRQHTRIAEPNMYHVIMHNDDFTTMEFVVEVLRTVFFKDPSSANKIMLTVHSKGSAIVGLYTYDVAQSKIQKAMRMAREQGFPFKLTCEPDALPF